MKIDIDKKLLKYAIYVTFTVISIYIAFLIIFNIGSIIQAIFSFLSKFLDLTKPLIYAIIIAYLLFPVIRFIENFFENNKIYKIHNKFTQRILSIILSYFAVACIFLGLLCGIYFMIGGQLSKNTTITNIIEEISRYVTSNSFSTTSISDTLKSLNLPFIDTLEPYIVTGINWGQNYLTSNIGNMTYSILSIGTGVATFFISLVISIYLLKDSEYFINLWNTIYYLIFRNSKAGKSIKYILLTVHGVFGKFIRGQLLEAFFVGILSTIALEIAGINYAFVIGLIAGICNMIPYVGPIVGTILASIIGLLSGRPIKAIYAIISMLIVQQIDNHLLAPKIVGDSVGLHPVFIIMAIIIGGSVGGLFGMLLSVPITAAFRLLFNNWYINYMSKEKNKNIKD